MSVGFSFLAGDFVAALQLVSTVIDALRDSGDSSTEYRALISQLFTLETALLKVKRLEADDEQHAEIIALQQAACQCQRTIDAFWEKIKKYQPSLRTGGSGSRVRDGWSKIQWALCKKDDLVKFKAELVGHTESIDLLLTTLHMDSTQIGRKKQDEMQKTLARKLQGSYFGCMQRLSQIMNCITTGVEQGKRILEMTAEVIQTNVQMFRIVLDIHSIITNIPGQIDRQQPVYFIDALGRHTPFHLEFVLSAEALTHVLRSNFKSIGSGSQKIERGEFAIQDTSLKRDIDLNGPWDSCFRPGQRVDMSMIFTSKKNSNKSCPACQQDNSDQFKENQDSECTNCGIIFRQTVSRAVDTYLHQSQAPLPLPCAVEDLPPSLQHSDSTNDDEDDLALFRRVRVKTLYEVKLGDEYGADVNAQGGRYDSEQIVKSNRSYAVEGTSRTLSSVKNKTMLSKALQKANTAVVLDNAMNFEGAMQAYSEACDLLQQVMFSSGYEDRGKLETIRNTYTIRISELERIAFFNNIDRALPARPESIEYEDDISSAVKQGS